MTATRVIDDHLELANIGVNTHAQIDSFLNGDTETIIANIDFVSSNSEDVIIPISKKVREVLRGRLYIDIDPGPAVAFSAWATYTFYSKGPVVHGGDAFYRTAAKMVLTHLEAITVVGSPNITPDDQTDFSPNDLALILGSPNEYVRLMMIANTMVAEDNLANVHAVDTGLVRVSEFSGFSLFNNESETNVYLRISFAVAQTVSLKLEMILRV